jgi:hypothetical protein
MVGIASKLHFELPERERPRYKTSCLDTKPAVQDMEQAQNARRARPSLHMAHKATHSPGVIMPRSKLLVLAALVLALTATACGEITGPKNACPVSGGSDTVTCFTR